MKCIEDNEITEAFRSNYFRIAPENEKQAIHILNTIDGLNLDCIVNDNKTTELMISGRFKLTDDIKNKIKGIQTYLPDDEAVILLCVEHNKKIRMMDGYIWVLAKHGNITCTMEQLGVQASAKMLADKNFSTRFISHEYSKSKV